MDQELLQEEYFAIFVRLIPSLTHQINNSMQAVRGALTLATEEINDPEELTVFIKLGLRETERVVQVVNQLRQVYCHQTNQKETFDLNQLLEDIIILTRKDLEQRNVNLMIDLTPASIPITAFIRQIRFVFIRLLLNLADVISEFGGGDLQIRSQMVSGIIKVEFSSESQLDALSTWTPGIAPTMPKEKDLLLVHEIISGYEGRFEVKEKAGIINLQIELPLPPPE